MVKNMILFILISFVFFPCSDGLCNILLLDRDDLSSGITVCSLREEHDAWNVKGWVTPSVAHFKCGFFSPIDDGADSFSYDRDEKRVLGPFQVLGKKRLIGVVTLFLFLLALLLVWWNRKLLLARRETEHVLLQLQHIQMQLKEKNVMLENLAKTDSLTGVYSRGKLEEILGYEIARSRRYHTPFGIVILDIDHFTRITESYGCQRGATYLQEIADLLLHNIRRVDVVGRWKGDVFLIVCPNGTVDGLFRLSEHLRALIEKKKFMAIGHGTASFGFALFEEDDELTTLIARADRGMCRAKSFGKNRVGMAEI